MTKRKKRELGLVPCLFGPLISNWLVDLNGKKIMLGPHYLKLWTSLPHNLQKGSWWNTRQNQHRMLKNYEKQNRIRQNVY